MVIVVLIYIVAGFCFNRMISDVPGRKGQDSEQSDRRGNTGGKQLMMVRLIVLSTNFVCTACLCIPTTMFWIEIMSDVNWVQRLYDEEYRMIFWATSLCAVTGFAELLLRFSTGNSGPNTSFVMLAVHHVAVFLLIITLIASGDVAVMKVNLTLLAAWTWEWTLFLSFGGVRVLDIWRGGGQGIAAQCYHFFVRSILPIMTFLYFSTRAIAIVGLFQVVGCGFHRGVHMDDRVGAAFWTASILAMVAVSIQIYCGMAIPGLRLRRMIELNESSLGIYPSSKNESD